MEAAARRTTETNVIGRETSPAGGGRKETKAQTANKSFEDTLGMRRMSSLKQSVPSEVAAAVGGLRKCFVSRSGCVSEAKIFCFKTLQIHA